MCDRHEEDAALLARGGERLGCYRDQAGHRVLRGFVRSSYEVSPRGAASGLRRCHFFW